jgi:hypothetical protein
MTGRLHYLLSLKSSGTRRGVSSKLASWILSPLNNFPIVPLQAWTGDLSIGKFRFLSVREHQCDAHTTLYIASSASSGLGRKISCHSFDDKVGNQGMESCQPMSGGRILVLLATRSVCGTVRIVSLSTRWSNLNALSPGIGRLLCPPCASDALLLGEQLFPRGRSSELPRWKA